MGTGACPRHLSSTDLLACAPSERSLLLLPSTSSPPAHPCSALPQTLNSNIFSFSSLLSAAWPHTLDSLPVPEVVVSYFKTTHTAPWALIPASGASWGLTTLPLALLMSLSASPSQVARSRAQLSTGPCAFVPCRVILLFQHVSH